MNAIFGIPVTTIMLWLVGLFVVSMAVGTWIVVRQRVVFRMGVRNIPRRPAQTVLIVVGLMLSTLIIAASFTTGDTLDASIRGEVLRMAGQSDEMVVVTTGERRESMPTGPQLPEQLAYDLEAKLAGNPAIDGVMPYLVEYVPAFNARTNLSEPALLLAGLDPARLTPFGGLRDLDGRTIDLAALPEDGVVLGEKAADNLDAKVGDILVVYAGNMPQRISVQAIAADSFLTGYAVAGAPGGLAMPLARAQALLGPDYAGQISLVDVTNPGGVAGGVDGTDAAMQALDAALAGTPWTAIPVKRDAIDGAEAAGNVFLTLFLIFGMFSISVGILLIFLIFVMLAAERKPEMGMARAVGMKRRNLTQMFLAEGIAYDLVAALVGAALGVGVAFAIAGYMARLLGDYFTITPTASWRGLVISYTLGVVVTFLTILIASWRVSKLTIVAAIRDVPEPVRQRESRRWLVFGILGALLGVLMTWAGAAGGSLFPFTLGVSLVPLALAVLLRGFGVPARPLYSVAAVLVLTFWLLPDWVLDPYLPEMSGGMEMFFISGVMMVASATVLIVWNAPVITGFVGMLGQTFSRWLPAVKTAVAYPLERKGRTGMTIAMFSLVIFALVMMATVSETAQEAVFSSDKASAGWDIQAVQAPVNPVNNLTAALVAEGVDTSAIAASGHLTVVDPADSQVRLAGKEEWETYIIEGASDDFLAGSNLPLQTRAVGYASDAAIWAAVRATPDLAVVDNNAIPGQTFSIGGPTFFLETVKPDDEVMQPVEIELGDPLTGTVRTVTIIGVLDSTVSTFPGIITSEATFDATYSPATVSYLTWVVRVQPGVDAADFAQKIEAALLPYGVQATSYRELIDEMTRVSRGFLQLIEGFMMLGLVVGVAALGVIAFRSVVERRQQIGMLRAIGFRQDMVAASFLIESAMITVLGVLSGLALALALSWQLISSEYFVGTSGSVGMVVPWLDVSLFIGVALAAALLMAWVPARRASHVPIAAALRYE